MAKSPKGESPSPPPLDDSAVDSAQRGMADSVLTSPGEAAAKGTTASTDPLVPAIAPMPLSPEDLRRLIEVRHDSPFDVLGPHRAADGRSVTIRTFAPGAARVLVRPLADRTDPASWVAMQRLDSAGVFAGVIANPDEGFSYELVIVDGDGRERVVRDAYAFDKFVFDSADAALFAEGRHARLYRKLGAHPVKRRKVAGVRFAVWAPRADRVSVVGTFNNWDGRCHPMQKQGHSGVWEIFVPGAGEGDLYKFEIRAAGGSVFLKSDPFAFRTETPPKTASIVHDIDWGYSWLDARWRQDGSVASKALAVWPVNMDSIPVMQEAGDGTLQRIAADGFSHVELTTAGPGLWGSAGMFAPGESRGAPEELMAFVDLCHAQGLGVIIPALQASLPPGLDDLAWFDGSQIYEAPLGEEPAAATAPAWAPAVMTFAWERGEVRSFLLSQAAFWAEHYHVDGWRTDRVTAEILAGGERGGEAAAEAAPVVICKATVAPPLPANEVARLIQARHADPFALLGLHANPEVGGQTAVMRTLQPRAEQVFIRFGIRPTIAYELIKVHPDGLFEASLPTVVATGEYRVIVKEPSLPGQAILDPYRFHTFSFSPFDQHLFNSGNHYRIYDKLGAHGRSLDGITGVAFAVWAPNAAGVSIVGPLNGWDGRYHQMARLGTSGVWELFLPEVGEGELYKFEIRATNGHTYLKADPYAFFTEVPPLNASIVYEPQRRYRWSDDAWMAERQKSRSWQQPVSIYEVHLGSWIRRSDGGLASYRELAERLIPYVTEMGFTHIELLPIAEHPFEPSWGYQVTNYYAPSARYGRPEDLMKFIDHCHQAGIGVIFDWVPGHFPKDAFALAWFDGTHLYEHADPRQGEHRDWGTLIFNYGRHEVENFLIANALFWLEHYHFDGLRVDAVASMLYLDYSRPREGEWIPNKYGGRENLEAIEFLKHTNAVVHDRFPGVMMIAEESTSWPKVSRPTDEGGLGFGFKWNMGWMHDTLAYMSCPPEERRYHHNRITFSIVYAFNENFILSLSHDEVVHLKGSLFAKMPGEDWARLANLRLLFTYMYAHPGKKLLFMGGEFGQRGEWNHAAALAWDQLENAGQHQLQGFVADLNRLYRVERAFFEADFRGSGFEWLEVDNSEESIVAFIRKAGDPRNALIFVFNFSAISRPEHRLGVPYPVAYQILLDNNAHEYGGFGRDRCGERLQPDEFGLHGQPYSLRLPLAALSALVLKPADPDTAPLQLGAALR